MRTGIILQARMGSKRLAGKMLKPLAGVPLIDRVLDRLLKMVASQTLVLATSLKEENDVLAEHAARRGIPVFRGSEDDVLDRYCQAARLFELDHIVRATGDNPFVDVAEGDALIGFHLAHGFDYSCNFPDRGGLLPLGVGLEIFSRQALERSGREGTEPHHREHVDEFIYDQPQMFRCGLTPTPLDKQAPALRLTVDTLEDFELAERLVTLFGPDVTTERLIAHLTSDSGGVK